jgi:hypothetical protein
MIYTALGCTRLVTDFVELPVMSAPLPGANQNSFTTITPLHHFVATTTADSSSNQFMDLEIPGREYVCFTTTILRCPPKLRQGVIESCIEVSMYISRNASCLIWPNTLPSRSRSLYFERRKIDIQTFVKGLVGSYYKESLHIIQTLTAECAHCAKNISNESWTLVSVLPWCSRIQALEC